MFFVGRVLVFITGLLFSGLSASSDIEKIIDRYSSDEFINQIVVQAEELADKYSSDDFLDHVINADRYRREAQETFNRRSLWSIPGLDRAFTNKDAFLSGIITIDWLFEWYLYRFFFKTLHVLVRDELNSVRPERRPFGAESNGCECSTRQKLDEGFIKNIKHDLYKKLLPVLIVYVFCVTYSDRCSQYFCLTPDGSEASPQLLQALFSLPLPFFQQTIIHKLTHFLRDYGILGEWSDSCNLELARQLILVLLWVHVVLCNELEPMWKTWGKEKSDILDIWLQKEPRDQQALLFFVEQGLTMPFAQWLTNKQTQYAKWNVMVQGVILLPACYTLGRWLYKIIHVFKMGGDTDDKKN